MAKILLIIPLVVILLGGAYLGYTGKLNNLIPSKEEKVQQVTVKLSPVPTRTTQISPTPDVSDQSIDQDFSGLESDISNLSSVDTELSKEMTGL